MSTDPTSLIAEIAEIIDPEAFEDHPIEHRSHAAALQWSARRHIAMESASRFLHSEWLTARDREVAAGAVEAAADSMTFTDEDQLHAVEAMAEGEWTWFLWLARQKVRDCAQAIREGRA